MTGCPSFLRWAGLFYAMADCDAEERYYKLRAVRRLVEARNRLVSGGDWTVPLNRGFKNPDNNLVSHRQFVPFLDWVDSSPDRTTEALLWLWDDGSANAADRLDAFSTPFPWGRAVWTRRPLQPRRLPSRSRGPCPLA
jgi:hypothetical protein